MGTTKRGTPCQRTTCLIRNVPWCWQHAPAAIRNPYIRKQVQRGLKPIVEAPRIPMHAHMVRAFGNSTEDVEIIDHQLASVYTGQKGWSGLAYISKGKVRAHIIVQKPTSLGRFVRAEFTNMTLRKIRQHTTGTDVLYVQSIGVDRALRRKGIAKLLLNSYKGKTLWLHAESAGAVAAYKKSGFREHPALQEENRVFMTKG